MEGSVKLDLDKLPIKRLYAIDELGNEQFPAEIDHEEKRLDMIRRIDFSWVVEKDAKKQKSSKDSVSQPVWQWQGLVENLRLAHEELSIILDLINTVEANDAVTVAGMQRPKQLPHEALSDIAVSAATKLQRLRHLGRYFKQSSKALEQQVVREARFYGSLISLSYRLQQNWKVKRQRLAAAGPGSDGFTIDLLDSSLPDQQSLSRPSSFSSVRVDHNSAGVLAVQLPLRSCRSICLRFLGAQSSYKPRSFGNSTMCSAGQSSGEVKKDIFTDDDAQRCVKDAHTILREIHRSIFEEQVFDMVNREMYNPSPGVNVTGMREDFLQLDIGQESSICLCLMVSGKQDNTQPTNSTGQTENGEGGVTNADSLALTVLPEKYDTRKSLPNPVSLEIFLQDMFHRNVVTRVKERCKSTSRHLMSGQRAGDKNGLLCHFCMAISHRIFANRVLSKLECLVSRVPYLHLLSQPTWHSRTSSWTLIWNVPQSVLRYGSRTKPLDAKNARTGIKSQFHTKVVVNDDRISVSGEGAPSVIGSFRSDSLDACAVNCYSCDLEDLSMILLQQVAGQVIRWLHEEASVVGMKASRDFLCLYFDLDQGETLGLVAHVDPHDFQGCISWWVVLDDGSMDEGRLSPDKDEWENRGRYLGHLSLETLYSTLMDLVNLCSSGGSR